MSSRQTGFKWLCVQQSSLLTCPWAKHLIPAAPWVLLPPWPWSLTSLEGATDRKAIFLQRLIIYHTFIIPLHSPPIFTGLPVTLNQLQLDNKKRSEVQVCASDIYIHMDPKDIKTVSQPKRLPCIFLETFDALCNALYPFILYYNSYFIL